MFSVVSNHADQFCRRYVVQRITALGDGLARLSPGITAATSGTYSA
jgi:hypothetical protein